MSRNNKKYEHYLTDSNKSHFGPYVSHIVIQKMLIKNSEGQMLLLSCPLFLSAVHFTISSFKKTQ